MSIALYLCLRLYEFDKRSNARLLDTEKFDCEYIKKTDYDKHNQSLL